MRAIFAVLAFVKFLDDVGLRVAFSHHDPDKAESNANVKWQLEIAFKFIAGADNSE